MRQRHRSRKLRNDNATAAWLLLGLVGFLIAVGAITVRMSDPFYHGAPKGCSFEGRSGHHCGVDCFVP